MIPVTDCNTEIYIESAPTRWPAKNMSEHDFTRHRTREEVFRVVLVCDLVNSPDYFKNSRIYTITLNF